MAVRSVRRGTYQTSPQALPQARLRPRAARSGHIALPLGSSMLMASDVTRPEDFTVGTNSYVALEADSGDEADRVFAGLTDGGKVDMPLQKTEWAEKFGIGTDRFGVQWMVSHTGDVRFGQA